MSVYIPRRKDGSAKSPFYQYDFQLRPAGAVASRRFHGSTGQTTKRAALKVEARIRELAASGTLTSDMTVNEACWRYWEEHGQHRTSKDDIAHALELIRRLIGSSTLLVAIDSEKIADAVRQRSGDQVMRRRKLDGKLVRAGTGRAVTNSTVNRTFTEPLRRLLRRAKKVWKVPIDLDAIDWAELLLEEPEGRTRTMQDGEEARFWEALRLDYHPLVEIYLISGRRRSDYIGLQKSKVDLPSRSFRVPSRKKKKKGEIAVTMTQREFEIIASEAAKSNDPEIFTYLVQRGADKGLRAPITKSGFRKEITRALSAAGIEDFRTHDLRHTFATRLLRLTGNLKLLQKAMNHSDIKSTMVYAHVLDEEVTAARERVRVSRNYPGTADFQASKKQA